MACEPRSSSRCASLREQSNHDLENPMEWVMENVKPRYTLRIPTSLSGPKVDSHEKYASQPEADLWIILHHHHSPLSQISRAYLHACRSVRRYSNALRIICSPHIKVAFQTTLDPSLWPRYILVERQFLSLEVPLHQTST